MSRIGYVIGYMGYPVLRYNMLQIELDLITIEAEYIALIQTMRKVIPFMALMRELNVTFDIHLPKIEVFLKLFKDNQSCIGVS